MKGKRNKFIGAHSSAKCRVGNSRYTRSHSSSLLTSPLVTHGYERSTRVTHRPNTLHPPDLRHPTELELGTTQGHPPFHTLHPPDLRHPTELELGTLVKLP